MTTEGHGVGRGVYEDYQPPSMVMPRGRTASGKSSDASYSSAANTVARFGSTAESYSAKDERARQRRRPSNGSVEVPAIQRLQEEQKMWSSLPATNGSAKIPKQKDMCDKATRSKIDRWIATAAPLSELSDDSSAGSSRSSKERSDAAFNPITGLQQLKWF